jgi:hypothetical protein
MWHGLSSDWGRLFLRDPREQVSSPPHQRTETDPVSTTLCFLVFRIPNDGQSPGTQWMWFWFVNLFFFQSSYGVCKRKLSLWSSALLQKMQFELLLNNFSAFNSIYLMFHRSTVHVRYRTCQYGGKPLYRIIKNVESKVDASKHITNYIKIKVKCLLTCSLT